MRPKLHRYRERPFVASVMLVVLSGAAPTAQNNATKPSQFDVTSVKPNRTLDAARRLSLSPTGFNATNVTLKELIRGAYGLQALAASSQIVGGPNWIDSDRFDVAGRVESGSSATPPPQVLVMVRALLSDRFKLQVHEETRDAAVYALVVNRQGQFGPRLKRSTLDCDCFLNNRSCGDVRPGPEVCGFQTRPGRMFGPTTMARLATDLSQVVDRVVVDRTNLPGLWELMLDFVADSPVTAIPDANSSRTETDGVSIFTALQEQAGLRLQNDRAPIQVLVIDRAEQPSAD
jgi:uncharacterized protein (TIGR03435 family)